jgi:iron complex outermembrane recepter protein
MFAARLEKRRAHLLCSTGLAIAGLALSVPFAAYAQDGGSVETVVVTGSRLPTVSAFDAPTPVTIVSSSDIKYSGTLNVETLLQQTPEFVGATNGGPSSNTQQANGNSGGAYVNLRGLNTTFTTRSLVLVDGKRYTINGTNLSTDLNTIPTALIERTEIVTGGSSAVYGSDAVAGVVNFIMKKNFTGMQVDSHVDFDSDTTTPTYSFDVTAGANFDHDRGNIAVSMNYLNRGGITQSQVKYASVPLNESCVTPGTWSARYPGTSNGSSAANCASSGGKMGFTQGGSTSSPAGQFSPIYHGADATLTTPTTGLYALAGLTWPSAFTFDSSGVRDVNNPADLYNLTALNFMQIPQERWMINAFVHYDITPHITAYAEMHFSQNNVTVQLTPPNLGGQQMLFNTDNSDLSPEMQAVLTRLDQLETGPVAIPEGAKTYTTTPGDGLAILNINRRFAEVGNRVDQDQRTAWRFAGGFRGDIGSLSADYFKDLSYDIYYMYTRTADMNNLSGMISRSKIQDAVLGANPVCDIFGPNMSSSCVSAVSITANYDTKAEMAGAGATITGTAFDDWAGPVDFDLGAEWRFTSAQYQPDYELNSGDVAGFNGSKPTNGSESVREVFGELRVPVLADMPMVKKFTANGAFRMSDYNLSGVGTVWTYSVGGDWKVIDDLTFRGQFQHSIRAPNVGELYGGSALNFASSTIDPCGASEPIAGQTAALKAMCVATGVPASNVWTTTVQDTSNLVGYITGGNPTLHAEVSDTITFGTVVTPTIIPALAVSIDWYSIDIKGAIANFGGSAANVLNNCYSQSDPTNQNCVQIHRNSFGTIAAPTYINLGETNLSFIKTQGFDIGGHYGFDVDWGLLDASSTIDIGTNWTWIQEFKSENPGQAAQSCVGLFGQTCQEPMPRLKGASRVTWSDGPLSLSLRWRYLSSVTDDRHVFQSVPLDQLTNPVIPAYYYFDLSGSYNIDENLTFTAGVNNLFDRAPPVEPKSSYGNTWPATYDAFGQTFFINLTAKTD